MSINVKAEGWSDGMFLEWKGREDTFSGEDICMVNSVLSNSVYNTALFLHTVMTLDVQ